RRGDVEIAVVVEVHATACVAAAVDLGVPGQQVLPGALVDRGGFVVVGEPRYRPLADPFVRVDGFVRHPVDVDPAVVGEVRVEGDAEQPLLAFDQLVAATAVTEHLQRGHQLRLPGLRLPCVDGAAAQTHVLVFPVGDGTARACGPADVEDGAVVGDGEAVRFADLVESAGQVLLGQPFDLVIGRDRRLAVTADDARGPLQRAE